MRGIQVRNRGSVSLQVTNSTVASNSARQEGGGILQEGGDDAGDHSAGLLNTIVAGDTAPQGPDLVGGFGARFSLIGDGTGSDVTNTDGNQVGNVPPFTGAIDPRSRPARAQRRPDPDACPAARKPGHRRGVFQRMSAARPAGGIARPQGPACDIGSYERASP